MNKKPTDIATRTPINRQAARVLQRAPWWAHLQEIRTNAKRVIPPNEWELHADLFAPPPYNKEKQQPKDRRGTRIKFSSGVEGVVTGYSYAKKGSHGRAYACWVVCDDGHVTTVLFGKGSRNRYSIIPDALADTRK